MAARAACAPEVLVRLVPARERALELVCTKSDATLLYDCEMVPSDVKMATV